MSHLRTAAALCLVPKGDLEREGYGRFLSLFAERASGRRALRYD